MASCNTRWVRLIVHSIFCMITVVSFILILMTSIQRPANDNISKCVVSDCRVVCSQAPYFNNYESHVMNAVKEAYKRCRMVSLVLNRPMFVNETLPQNWFNEIQDIYIFELQIIGGNLKYIAPDAFMTELGKNIRILELEEITLAIWEPNMFVGLTNLRDLIIKDSTITNILKNALRPIDDSLQNLMIKSCGDWDPINVTGSAEYEALVIVDFSYNNFGNILGPNSFLQLKSCKVLNLVSSRITAISLGAFDYMDSIEFIYLSNNQLITVASGLFDKIISKSPQPLIDLHYNSWNCDCNLEHVRKLHSSGLILGDPLCHEPKDFKDMYFSEILSFCVDNETSKRTFVRSKSTQQTTITPKNNNTKEISLSVETNCYTPEDKIRVKDILIISPTEKYKCAYNMYNDLDLNVFSNISVRTANMMFSPSFYINDFDYSMLQINILSSDSDGIVWFQSTCPKKIYCVSSMPSFLRIYNVDSLSWFTMCPTLSTGHIALERCIKFNPAKSMTLERNIDTSTHRKILFNILCALVGLSVGAFIIYGLIRKNPELLRGSKRILLVKHKAADALVLPPSLPSRPNFLDTNMCPNQNVWVVPFMDSFSKSCTIRSNKSSAPSYISALQPTEEQMKEWRLQNHFSKDLMVTSNKSSNTSLLSWLNDTTDTYPKM